MFEADANILYSSGCGLTKSAATGKLLPALNLAGRRGGYDNRKLICAARLKCVPLHPSENKTDRQ